MKIKLLFILLALAIVMSSVRGQTKSKKVTISGHVMDVTNKPVEGVVILIDSEDSGIKTNSKGYYKIRVNQNADSLGAFTYFDDMTIALNNNTTIDFSLSKAQDPVRTAAGKSASNYNTIEGSVTKNARYANIYEMLSNTVPGVTVNGKSITIRGQTTFYANPPPLFDVDGVIENSIDHINPLDVVSIEVLKTSAAAIYGDRGSYGVIKIKL